VIVALGDQNTGIMGNDQALMDEIINLGKETGEGFWQLPLGPEYSKQIRSDIADIKNIGPRGKAGTIMGAVFHPGVRRQSKMGTLDIAGTAWSDAYVLIRRRANRGCLRTLVKFIEASQ
jgi:leucyl aminopeptidase